MKINNLISNAESYVVDSRTKTEDISSLTLIDVDEGKDVTLLFILHCFLFPFFLIMRY